MIGIIANAFVGEEGNGCDNDIVYKVLTNNTARCAYIHKHIEDCVGESLINYYDLFYCKLEENYFVTALFTIVLMTYIFYALTNATQEFLAPAMARCVKPSNGVTLLAAANGAQDLASSIVAAFAEEASDLARNPVYLALGALIGAAVAINMIITSVVTIRGTTLGPIKMPRMAFIKDVFFLQLVLVFVCLYNFHGRIDLWMGLVFIVLYMIYVLISVVFMGQPQPDTRVSLIESLDSGDKSAGNGTVPGTANKESTIQINPGDYSEEISHKMDQESEPETLGEHFNRTVKRFVPEDWQSYSIFEKILFFIVKLPCQIVLKATMPSPDEENWDPFLAVIWPFFFGIFCFFHFELHEETPNMMIWYAIIVGSITLVYTIFGLVRIDLFAKPSFAVITIYSILCLGVSCIWIWFLCNFVLDTLTLLGFVTELSAAFLGASVLAIGNCVGDFIADISIAGLNLIDMAITGTYSSPTFNLMLGLGSTIIINCINGDYGYIPFKFGSNESIVTFWSIIVLLAYNFIFLGNTFFNNFYLKRTFAYVGIGCYVLYLGMITYIAFSVMP